MILVTYPQIQHELL